MIQNINQTLDKVIPWLFSLYIIQNDPLGVKHMKPNFGEARGMAILDSKSPTLYASSSGEVQSADLHVMDLIQVEFEPVSGLGLVYFEQRGNSRNYLILV